jgi:hypothetical protein
VTTGDVLGLIGVVLLIFTVIGALALRATGKDD